MENNKKNLTTYYLLRSTKSGFTLVETLVAIFILTVGITSVISLMTSSFFSAQYSNNEITGTYLAQEAMDYIRNNRDTTAFQSGDWVAFLGNFGYGQGGSGGDIDCFTDDGCYLDVTDLNPSTSVQGCTGIALYGSIICPQFYYNPSPNMGQGGYYTYNQNISGTTLTSFKRRVHMELSPDHSFTDTNGNTIKTELDITVTVEWQNGSSVRSTVLRGSLLKWQ